MEKEMVEKGNLSIFVDICKDFQSRFRWIYRTQVNYTILNLLESLS